MTRACIMSPSSHWIHRHRYLRAAVLYPMIKPHAVLHIFWASDYLISNWAPDPNLRVRNILRFPLHNIYSGVSRFLSVELDQLWPKYTTLPCPLGAALIDSVLILGKVWSVKSQSAWHKEKDSAGNHHRNHQHSSLNRYVHCYASSPSCGSHFEDGRDV
jgi:hypothetical protein